MRRLIGIALLLTGLCLLASGAARPASARTDAVTVTLAGWASSPAETALLRRVLARFERSNPNIDVEYSVINGDYPTAMLARFAAHTPPDVFYVDSSAAPEWSKQRLLEPLNSFVKRTKFDLGPFYPRLLAAFRRGNLLYGLPKDWSPLAMETNTAMLSEARVAPPRTWQQLTRAAVRLRNADAVPGGAPLCLGPDWARLLAFVHQNKGSLLNSAGTRVTIQSPAAAEAVRFYVGLIRRGLAATPTRLGVDWCGEALGKEKAAIVFEGNWLLPYMRSTFPNVRYGIHPLVRGKTRGNLAFTVSYSMARDSDKKPAAWALIRYLTGRQGMRAWTSSGLALPSRSDVKPAGRQRAFVSEAPYARPWGFPGFSDVYTVMNNDLGAVIRGNKSIAEMLADVAKALRRALLQ